MSHEDITVYTLIAVLALALGTAEYVIALVEPTANVVDAVIAVGLGVAFYRIGKTVGKDKSDD